MYFFTNYDKNILGDTFLSWYDSGKPQTYLYKGYPTGYIIIWKNPAIKLKDGTISQGKCF